MSKNGTDENLENLEEIEKLSLTVVGSILGVVGFTISFIWILSTRNALKEPKITQQTNNILSAINFLFISGKKILNKILI